MSQPTPPDMRIGPLQGKNIIGEITENVHRFLLDGWDESLGAPPRIEEDLSFIPKDREEVIYVYMYRVAQNTALMNSKRPRLAKFSAKAVEADAEDLQDGLYYERPPIYLDVHYLVAVHSKFRSDAERLLGWLMLRLHEATHLVYRPRKYTLPNGRELDSTGAVWGADNNGEEVIMEKVSLALGDDLTVGDAINFFTIHEAPYRPYLTYKARCSMEGPLLSGPESPTEIMPPDMRGKPSSSEEGGPRQTSRNGRMSARPDRGK